MLAPQQPRNRFGANRFLLLHAFVIPAAFAFAAMLASASGLDERLSGVFFDAASGSFPARGSAVLEAFGHRLAKSAVVALWLLVLIAALVAAWLKRPRGERVLLWATTAAMAVGPAIVVTLKELNSHRCPWDLKQFGGIAYRTSEWFVSSLAAGHCFPSGHAAGGFCLVACYFAAMALRRRALQSGVLLATLGAGAGFGLVRIAQGAHFLSHNLWSAAIDWCAAALLFAPLLARNAASGASIPRAP